MKIAILNDTHAGVRSDMVEMSNYQGRFYEEDILSISGRE